MRIDVIHDADSVGEAAAGFILTEAKAAVAARGRFTFAVSGGQTPWRMLGALARKAMPWENVFVFQVDERVAPDGDPERNLTRLREHLLRRVPLHPANIHAMPVEQPDLETAAAAYSLALRHVAGSPPVLDLVQLGLGLDGHTASLLPADPVLEVVDKDVAVTAVCQGRRRMTLTYPVLNRARRVLWVITGNEKAGMLARLIHRDQTIPAGRVLQDRAVVFADQAVAEE